MASEAVMEQTRDWLLIDTHGDSLYDMANVSVTVFKAYGKTMPDPDSLKDAVDELCSRNKETRSRVRARPYTLVLVPLSEASSLEAVLSERYTISNLSPFEPKDPT